MLIVKHSIPLFFKVPFYLLTTPFHISCVVLVRLLKQEGWISNKSACSPSLEGGFAPGALQQSGSRSTAFLTVSLVSALIL